MQVMYWKIAAPLAIRQESPGQAGLSDHLLYCFYYWEDASVGGQSVLDSAGAVAGRLGRPSGHDQLLVVQCWLSPPHVSHLLFQATSC